MTAPTKAGMGKSAEFYRLLIDDCFAEQLWKLVDRRGDADCWPWTGQIHIREGYGYMPFRVLGTRLVHRIIYRLCIGPLPEKLVIDHLCRNRTCCNPAHLECVTTGENVRRGMGPAAINNRKTHCKNGHEFDLANTLLRKYSYGIHRHCRACDRERYHRRVARERASV